MNQKNIFRVLWSTRFSAMAALIAVGLLFVASGAKAGGCAVGYKAGATAPPIPFVNPQPTTIKTSTNHMGMPSSVYGM